MNTNGGASELRPLEASACDCPRVSVDVVIFTLRDGDLRVLLVRRKGWPFEGLWAIPGGAVGRDEALEAAAQHKLAEETGLTDVFLEQLYTFGRPDRDPRERTIIEMRYGLQDGHYHTLDEVSAEFKLTRERIRQIEVKALRKLRYPERYYGLREYVQA